MMIVIKDETVNLSNLCPQLAMVLSGTVLPLYNKFGADDVVITSGNDGTHSRTSLHYSGYAVDIRTHNVTNPQHVAVTLSDVLGPDFDCIYENDHIHIEYQPKRK